MSTSGSTELNFLDQFTKTFELFSYGNALYGRLCSHILLGQKLRNLKLYFGPIYIDPRVSLFLIQPSGTGKSTPWNFIRDIALKAQMAADDIDEATDAALIGTCEEEEVIDPETHQKTVIYNAIQGKLANSDLLHYDEGQMLVKRGQYSQNTLAWLQKALNPIDSGQNLVSKYLAKLKSPIQFHPHCSLLITSHEIDCLLEVVLDTGFFQRIVLYPRYVPIESRKKNEFLRADRFCKRIFTEIDVDTIAAKLVEVGKKYENWEIQVDENIYPVIHQKIADMYALINTAHERVREIMATFVPRYDNLIYIFALHHCCANLKDKVDVEDVKYASQLMVELFKDIMSWVEENISILKLSSKELSYLNSAFIIYKGMEKTDEGYVMKISFMKECCAKWKISMHTIIRYLEKFQGFGKLKEVELNNTKFIKIEA